MVVSRGSENLRLRFVSFGKSEMICVNPASNSFDTTRIDSTMLTYTYQLRSINNQLL